MLFSLWIIGQYDNYQRIEHTVSKLLQTLATPMILSNSTINTFLKYWRMREIKKAVEDKIRKVWLFISLRNCIGPSVMKVVVIPVLQFNQFGYTMFLFR